MLIVNYLLYTLFKSKSYKNSYKRTNGYKIIVIIIIFLCSPNDLHRGSIGERRRVGSDLRQKLSYYVQL